MSPKSRKHREYRFEIDAFTPATIPMARLAEYVSDLAKMFGNNSSVHLGRIEGEVPCPSFSLIGKQSRRSESV